MDLLKMTEVMKNVEEAYEGFNPFKNGSIWDKVLSISAIFFFFGSAIAFFIFYVCKKNDLRGEIISFATFLLATAFAYWLLRKHFVKRESFSYHQSKDDEIKFLDDFISRLSKKGINSDSYPKIIEFYQNKIEKENATKISVSKDYFYTIFIPLIMSTVKQGLLESALIASLGILIVPGAMFTISCFANKKRLCKLI